MIKVLFLFGEICSGKSTYEPNESYVTIQVSDIVRRVAKVQTREQLQNTKDLDSQIADALIEEIHLYKTYRFDENFTPRYVVVDGIRQHSILQRVEQYVEKYLPTWLMEYEWLEVSRKERKRRFEARKAVKDNISFDEAEKRDNQLGLSELFSILKEQNKI